MKFFLFAGEPSGDLHGSHLMQQLQLDLPQAQFMGVGGPKMRSVGLAPLMLMEDFAVMGFSDVLKNLPKIYRQFCKVSQAILEIAPDAVILIDYPDFNLRLAKRLRKCGYRGKIVQYISPTVWAWRKGRIKSLAENFDLLLTIYPFEEEHFKSTSLPVSYVGNPLCEYLSNYAYDLHWKERLQVPQNVPIVALFPGSRHGEIERNLPLQLQATDLLLKQAAEERAVAISCGHPEHAFTIMQQAEKLGWSTQQKLHLIPPEYTYELMRDSHVAIAKSGTVTLELALHQRPTVVLYKMSAVNYFIAKHVMRLNLPHYCMVNILLQKEAFPECIERGLTAQNIFKQLQKLDSQGTFRDGCIADCQRVAELLKGNSNASRCAAEEILKGLKL